MNDVPEGKGGRIKGKNTSDTGGCVCVAVPHPSWLVVALLGADIFAAGLAQKTRFSDMPSGKVWQRMRRKNCALRCTFVLGETLS